MLALHLDSPDGRALGIEAPLAIGPCRDVPETGERIATSVRHLFQRFAVPQNRRPLFSRSGPHVIESATVLILTVEPQAFAEQEGQLAQSGISDTGS